MPDIPKSIFLDTNVFIIGASSPDSPEAAILDWAGFGASGIPPVEVIASDALFKQILRVARRLRGKDWGGEIVARIWQGMNVRYVLIDPEEAKRLLRQGTIPREDVEIYLTSKAGGADCFISANRELVRVLADRQGDFEYLDAEAFVAKYLAN